MEMVLEKLKGREISKVKDNVSIPAVITGEASTPGAVQGRIVFDIKKAEFYAKRQEPVIFVSTEENRDLVLDTIFTYDRVGLITTHGNSSDHEADLTREAGIPSIINIFATVSGNQMMYHGGIIKEGDVVVLDGDNKRIFSTEDNFLEESHIVADASYRVNIPEYRKKFTAPYLTPEGKLKEEFTYDKLLEITATAYIQFDKIKQSNIVGRERFLANLEMHFLHDLLKERAKESGYAEKVRLDLREAIVRMMQLQFPRTDDPKDHPCLETAEINQHKEFLNGVERAGDTIFHVWTGYWPGDRFATPEGKTEFDKRYHEAMMKSQLLADEIGGRVDERKMYLICHEPSHPENEDLMFFIYVLNRADSKDQGRSDTVTDVSQEDTGGDRAQMSAPIGNYKNINDTGGIDFTSGKILSGHNVGNEIKFHLDPAMLEQLRNAPGFVPVIISVQPLKNLQEFLGLNDLKAVKDG